MSDMKVIEVEARDLGLLNRSKTELICPDHTTRVINHEQAELLGAPLGDNASVDVYVDGKIKMLELTGDRLQYLHFHDAFTLLRHSFAIPKMLHVLRTSPCFNLSRLVEYDGIVRALLCNIANIRLEETDPAWLQATLPVNKGGWASEVQSFLLHPPFCHQLMAHAPYSTR